MTLKPLPYALDALHPVMSKTQLEVHYTKHHKTYVENLNKFIKEAEQAKSTNDMNQYVKL